MWKFCHSRKPLWHWIASQKVLQLTNPGVAFSTFAIAVLSADRVPSHSSVKLCDLEILWWLDLIAIFGIDRS
jgi:hypothetical protein